MGKRVQDHAVRMTRDQANPTRHWFIYGPRSPSINMRTDLGPTGRHGPLSAERRGGDIALIVSADQHEICSGPQGPLAR